MARAISAFLKHRVPPAVVAGLLVMVVPGLAFADSVDMHVAGDCMAMEKGATPNHGEFVEANSNGDSSITSASDINTLIICPFQLPAETYKITTVTIWGDDDEDTNPNRAFSAAVRRRTPGDVGDLAVGSTWSSVDSNFVHTSSDLNHIYVHPDLYYVIIEIPGGNRLLWAWAVTVNYTIDP